jgi:hypothetical protein
VKDEAMLTLERLRELLIFVPETGLFYWKVDRPPVRAGVVAGGLNGRGYIQICIDKHLYLAHRLAWLYMTGEWPPADIDHENLNRSDNRWTNLRDATRSQNGANQGIRSDNTSGFKGVFWCTTRKRWLATLNIDGKQKTLGRFDTPEAAADAYAAAARKHFGEFSRTT